MNTNCLVKKLKGTVNNPNLEKLGHIILECVSGSNNFVSIVCAPGYEPLKVTVIEGSIDHVTSGVSMIDSTHCVVPSGTSIGTGLFTESANQAIVLDIEGYYGMQQVRFLHGDKNLNKLRYTQATFIDVRNPASEFDVESFSSFSACRSIELRDTGNKFNGNLSFIKDFPLTNFLYMSAPSTIQVKLNASDFSNITTLVTLILEDNKISTISGDIATLFGSLTSLTTLRIAGTNISGTVEGFVAAQIAAGRTTCTGITIGRNLAGVTYNGSVISGSSSKTLSWTSANDITIA